MSCCLVKTGELGPTFLHSCYWWCVQEQSLCGNKAFPLSSPAHHHGGPHGVREEGKRRREPKAQHFKCLPFGPSGQIFICAGPSGPKLGNDAFERSAERVTIAVAGKQYGPPPRAADAAAKGHQLDGLRSFTFGPPSCSLYGLSFSIGGSEKFDEEEGNNQIHLIVNAPQDGHACLTTNLQIFGVISP